MGDTWDDKPERDEAVRRVVMCPETMPVHGVPEGFPCRLEAGHAGDHELSDVVSWSSEWAAQVREQEARLEKLRAERAREREERPKQEGGVWKILLDGQWRPVQDLVDALRAADRVLSWGTTCASCAGMLDKAYADYARMQKVAEELDAIAEAMDAVGDGSAQWSGRVCTAAARLRGELD